MKSSSSRPPTRTTKSELGVVDLLTQHDVSMHQDVARHGHLGPRPVAAMLEAIRELA